MFKATITKNKDKLPGISLEFYGLKTYNDLLDKLRNDSLNLFFLFVNTYNLENKTYLKSIDLAIDFQTSIKSFQLINTKFTNMKQNIFKGVEDYSSLYYTADLYYEADIRTLCKDAKIINFFELYLEVSDRFINNKPIDSLEAIMFTKLNNDGAIDISERTLRNKWQNYDYDILITSNDICCKYNYIQKFNSTSTDNLKLTLSKPNNRVVIYDKAGKEGLCFTLTRGEFTFLFDTKISFNDFMNKEIFHNILLERLNNYSLFINDCLFDFNDLGTKLGSIRC